MSGGTLWIDGVAVWAPTLPGWAAAAPLLAQTDAEPAPPAPRPAPALLAAAERRRAPDGVVIALEVASAATAMAGAQADSLPSVFASAHGDLAITDAMCRTLATDPRLLSPTRFHHSVHNAASGYWAIAAANAAASTALAAFEHSFAAGLLEAAVQATADATPVLLVAADTGATGALASTNSSRGLLALALVLSPRRTPRALHALRWQLRAGAAVQPLAGSRAAQALAANASAAGLPLLEALARGGPARLAWPLSPALHLAVELLAPAPAGPGGPEA
jgi:Beta-ketoacyl synthase, N-terminal domain